MCSISYTFSSTIYIYAKKKTRPIWRVFLRSWIYWGSIAYAVIDVRDSARLSPSDSHTTVIHGPYSLCASVHTTHLYIHSRCEGPAPPVRSEHTRAQRERHSRIWARSCAVVAHHHHEQHGSGGGGGGGSLAAPPPWVMVVVVA